MSEGWTLGREKCIRGAGRAAVCAPTARGRGRACGAGRGGRQRRGQGQRDSIADGTALRNIVGEEVAATLRTSEIRLGGSFFV